MLKMTGLDNIQSMRYKVPDIYCQAPFQFQVLVHSWSFQYQFYSVLFRLDKLDQEVMLFSLCNPPVNFSKALMDSNHYCFTPIHLRMV